MAEPATGTGSALSPLHSRWQPKRTYAPRCFRYPSTSLAGTTVADESPWKHVRKTVPGVPSFPQHLESKHKQAGGPAAARTRFGAGNGQRLNARVDFRSQSHTGGHWRACPGDLERLPGPLGMRVAAAPLARCPLDPIRQGGPGCTHQIRGNHSTVANITVARLAMLQGVALTMERRWLRRNSSPASHKRTPEKFVV